MHELKSMKPGRQQTVIAVERDGLNVRTLAIRVRILTRSPAFDIRDAVKAACTEYVQTPEGKETYDSNCGCFNWADFDMYVPNSICRKHAFEKISSDISDLEANWDEHLVDDSALPEPCQD